MLSPTERLEERFNHFIENDWVHLERQVAALNTKVWIVLAGSGTVLGALFALLLRS